MATDAVYDAIQDFLADNIDSVTDPDNAGALTVRYENEEFDIPEPPRKWLAMALQSSLYGQQSIGAGEQSENRWDESGQLWLTVYTAKGTGASAARNIAKQIADLFRGLQLLSDSLEFMDTIIGGGGASLENGNWYELPVLIEYRRINA